MLKCQLPKVVQRKHQKEETSLDIHYHFRRGCRNLRWLSFQMFEFIVSLPEVTIVPAEQFTWVLLTCSSAMSDQFSHWSQWVQSWATLPALLRKRATVFSPGVVAEGQGANSLCCHSYICKSPSDQSFKSIPSHDIDILLHTTRQCLSPFKIETGARCLKLCLIVLVSCCFCCFCVSCRRWHKRQGLEQLTKRSIHLPSISRAPRHSWNCAGREDPADLLKLFSAARNN